MLKNEIIEVDGTNWLVREATSHGEAMHSISMARVTGSVGSKAREHRNGVEVVTADVVRLHPDGRECLPYGEKGTDQSALLALAYQQSGLRGRVLAGALDEIEALATGTFPIHHDAAFLRTEMTRIITEARATIAKARDEAQKGAAA